MAENLNQAANESANREHNMEARRDAIKKLDRELRPWESQIEEAREEMCTLRQNFKADTGITIADFNAARRLASMEDDDERRGKIDNFRECYNALMPGEQLNWLDAMEQEETGAEAA